MSCTLLKWNVRDMHCDVNDQFKRILLVITKGLGVAKLRLKPSPKNDWLELRHNNGVFMRIYHPMRAICRPITIFLLSLGASWGAIKRKQHVIMPWQSTSQSTMKSIDMQ